MLNKLITISSVLHLLLSVNILSQEKIQQSFQNFFHKGKISREAIFNISLDQLDGNGSDFGINFRGLYPLFTNLETGGEIVYSNSSRSGDEDGFTNLSLILKYGFKIDSLAFTAGAQMEYNIGSERFLTSQAINGFFIAFNHRLNKRMSLNISINRIFGISQNVSEKSFYSYKISDNTDQIAVEFLYLVRKNLSLVFEATSNSYGSQFKHRTLMSLGVNFKTGYFGILRGVIGVDLENNSAKFVSIGLAF